MSSVILSGDTSGAVTVAVPAVAGTNTVTIAAQTGTLNAAGPAFSVYRNAVQSVTSATFTKVQFNTVEFDTANCYDPTTNYRFTPTVAGYYQINIGISMAGSTQTGDSAVLLYKNNSLYKRGTTTLASTAAFNLNTLVYMNGTTDYVEADIYFTGTTPQIYGASGNPTYSYMNGCLVRGA